MATAAQVGRMRIEFDKIDTALRRDMNRVVPAARRLGAQGMRDMFMELGPQLADKYGQAAGLAGAEYFESTTGHAARMAALTDPDAVQGSVRAFAGGFWTPDREAAFEQIAASLVRHALQAGRSTVVESATRNRLAYARAPEPGACRFCVMLASRGAAYGSARSAGEGNRWHDNCRCVVEPVGPGDALSYDVDAMYEQYMRDHYGS